MKEMRIYDLREAAGHCGVAHDTIIHFIEEEWVRPFDPGNLNLDDEDIARVRLVRTLVEEMEIHENSLSVVLHLIDEINHLRHLLRERSGE